MSDPVDWLQLSLSSSPKQNMSCSKPVRSDSARTEKSAAALCTLSRHRSPCSASLRPLYCCGKFHLSYVVELTFEICICLQFAVAKCGMFSTTFPSDR